MQVKFKKLDPEATTPTKGTADSAAFDLYTIDKVMMMPGSRADLRTGIAIEIPPGHVGLIFPRSGLAMKKGLTLTNCVGVIDEDFRGQLIVGLIHQGHGAYYVGKGERIAQLIIMPVTKMELLEVDELDAGGQRGEAGFGSTGRF